MESKGEIKVVGTGVVAPSGRQFIFLLVREGKDPVEIWSDTADAETDPNIAMTQAAFQKVYDKGFEDGTETTRS